MSLMLFIRFLASKRLAYYFKLVAVILLLSKIMSIYLRCAEKGLIYIAIVALFSRQPSFCIKCIKLNMCFSCNIYLVFNAKYILLCVFIFFKVYDIFI